MTMHGFKKNRLDFIRIKNWGEVYETLEYGSPEDTTHYDRICTAFFFISNKGSPLG